MLILTRRVGESIVVGDDIVLTVFEVRGDAVRVGIEAPRSVQVHRQEVYDELKRQNEQAVSPSADAVDSLSGALEGRPAGAAEGGAAGAAEGGAAGAAEGGAAGAAEGGAAGAPEGGATGVPEAGAGEPAPPTLVPDHRPPRPRPAKPAGPRGRVARPGAPASDKTPDK